jgi:Kef-type K+ transport system membrane component KefB
MALVLVLAQLIGCAFVRIGQRAVVGEMFAGILLGPSLPGRTSLALGLGAPMNTRGLMELIVLNVGLDLGIISPALFAMMLIMALATACAAGPLLGWLRQREAHEGETESTLLAVRCSFCS